MVIFILLALFTDVFQTRQAGAMPALIWMLGLAVIIAALVTLVTKTSRLVDAAQQRDSRLEQLEGSLEKIREELGQITQNSRLSESARQIAFRDNDRRAIRDAVFDKLQQQDFENTYRIISEMEALPGFKDLAGQLRLQADNYRGATAKERINQLIGHIERLFEDHQWAKASTQIERLIQTDPKNEMAQQMRQKLVEKKEERKKVLLQAWDDAIKRQATDRSIEILKDLDMYLTPNEALALQEAARDVFRTKLHNLGVQFSLAISDKQWAAALQTGQQIIHNFPNSRMAEEIAGRMEILKRRVEQQL
jgi:TolA-binding protein